MKKVSQLFIALTLVIIIVVIIAGQYFAYLRKAHSTLEDYYKFRGCSQLIEKTETYGICKLNSGKTIKIVLFEGRWYLDGDLPYKFLGFTF
jgi:hypothetical protein